MQTDEGGGNRGLNYLDVTGPCSLTLKVSPPPDPRYHPPKKSGMISKSPKITGPLKNTSAKLALTNAIRPTLYQNNFTTTLALICIFNLCHDRAKLIKLKSMRNCEFPGIAYLREPNWVWFSSPTERCVLNPMRNPVEIRKERMANTWTPVRRSKQQQHLVSAISKCWRK